MNITQRLVPFLLAVPLAAQAGPFGAWTLVSPPDLPRIIEEATASMNFIKRPIARGRLNKTNTAYKHLVIARQGLEFTIQYEDRQPQHLPADGHAVAWKREDGEAFLIAGRLDHGDLTETYKAEDGERTNVFHAEGTALTLTVTVKSEKLPKPITYQLFYKAR